MKTKSHSISGAFVFMLLGVFAVFSMLLVVLGAQAYRTTVDHDGLPVLALSSELDGERYVQYIYSYGGSLCELFTSARYGFSPEDGEAVCAAQRFEPALEGNLLTVRVTDGSGDQSTVYIARRCAQ